MSYDIHAYVESKKQLFAKLYLEQDYQIFAVLAGRPFTDGDSTKQLRGFPQDADRRIEYDYTIWISESGLSSDRSIQCCTKEKAEQWIIKGLSKRVHEDIITDPDVFNTHHMDYLELKKTLNFIPLSLLPRGYSILLDLMGKLPDSRFIFWFK